MCYIAIHDARYWIPSIGRFMLIPSRFALCCVVLVAGLAVFPSGVAQEQAATTTVDTFHHALVKTMQSAKSLGFAGRRDALDAVVKSTFDLPFIASIAVGRHWKSFSGSQRAAMVDTFTRLTVATYASRFDDYGGEKFVVTAVRELKRRRMLVRTEIRSPDGDVVQLDYVLHESAGAWKVINVIADGVSDLSIKRSEYASIIKQNGFDGLISRINDQISKLAGKS